MTYVKDLATGTLASGIGTSDSSITVNVGYGTPEEILGVWPNVPFFITVLPGSPAAKISNSLDSEVMLVTAISENAGSVTMTVNRAQRGTSAKVFNADDIVANAVYAEDAVLIGPDGAVDNPSPWIEGNDIKAGVVNAATKTANNITPSADTPAAWATALGGDGYFWTYYSSNCFTNQPDQYGQLETLITGQQIYQRWHGHSDGNESYRGGNGTGWYGISGGAGTFRKSYDADEEFSTRGSTSIPASANLNTLSYVIPGSYDVPSTTTAATLDNCPTTVAFTMKVIDVNRPIVGSAVTTTTWMNLLRVIYDINGAIWTQTVVSNGYLTWNYGEWKRLIEYTYASAHGQPLETPAADNVDVNSFTKSGIYRCYNPIVNGPVNPEYATVFVTSYSDDYRCTQYFHAIGDDGNGGIYARFSYYDYSTNSRKWTAWKALVTWP